MIRKIFFALILTLAIVTAYSIGDVSAGDCAKPAGCAKTVAASSKTDCAATCKAAAQAKCKMVEASACKGSACAGCNMCKGSKAHGKNCTAACCSRTSHVSHAHAVAKVSDVIPDRENKRVVLMGNVICGGCKLEGIKRCQPMLKTKDGKIYPLAGNVKMKKMGGCKGSDTAYEIRGRVKKIYGVKYVDVTSYSVL